jgi:polyhydroxyalkanoate synthesis regulator phasin
MNFDSITELVQKGFRVTLGAASSVVDAIQDPQKSAQKFSEIGTDFNRLTDELETKGTTTEKEARDFVDGLSRQFPNPFMPTPANRATVNTIATPVADAGIQAELKSLTEQLISLRQEIEQLKAQRS